MMGGRRAVAGMERRGGFEKYLGGKIKIWSVFRDDGNTVAGKEIGVNFKIGIK